MSITGFNSDGSATINGLTTMSSNIMNSDELFYDSSTIPVNVKTAIDGISVDVTVLEGQMITANSNISTLQGQVSTLDGEVNTLQSEMNTAQSDINTLQSEMNTAQSDIIALYSTTATSTAAIAGLVISQAAQDVTIAAHTVSIAALNGDVSTLQGQVSTLQVKTTDQSWGSLSGTTFSSKTNVGTTSAGVVLNTASASEFGSGILTSSVQPLTVSSTLAIGATQTSGALNIGTLSTRNGQINIGSTTTANAQITIGSTASASQVVNINGANLTVGGTGTTNLAVQSAPASNIVFGTDKTGGGIYFGMYNATASTNALFFNIGPLNTGSINFGTGASAKIITFGSAAATNNLIGTTTLNGVTNINTTSFSNTNIGNGAAGGNFTVNAAANIITGTTNTLTSTGKTEINSGIFDVNASSAITIDGATTTNITSVDDMTLQTTNPFGDLRIISAGTTTLTSTGETEINCSTLDINATSQMTLDCSGGMTFTETSGTMFFNKTGASGGINFQSANFVSIDAVDEFFLTGGGVAQITSTGSTVTLTANQKIELNATTGNVDIRAFATDVTVRGDQLLITSDTTTDKAIIHTSASNTDDYSGVNVLNGYGMRFSNTGAVSGGLELVGYDTGTSSIQTVGTAHSLNVSAGNGLNLTAVNALNLTATLDAITLTSGLNTNINAVTIKSDATTQILHHIGGVEVQEIGASGIINNPTGSITNQINSVTKQTISSTLITNTVPTVNSGLTYPITTTTALGYHSSTTSTTKFTNAAANLASLSIPAAGCYLCEGQWYFSGAVFTAQTFTTISISTTSATVNTQRQQTAYQGGASGNYAGQVTSIFNFTGASTVYLVGLAQNTLGGTSNQQNFFSITRIA